MSVISLLVVGSDQPPSLEELRREALLGGDPVEFSWQTDLKTHTGVLPMRAFGRDTGFEFYFEKVAPGEIPEEAMRFGSHQIITRTGSDLEEGRAALLFLKIAARLTGGACVYPDDGIVVQPVDVDSYLNEQIQICTGYIK